MQLSNGVGGRSRARGGARAMSSAGWRLPVDRRLLRRRLRTAASPARPPALRHPAVPTPADGRITLERRPCFGTCPVYTVTLERSGAVRFEGRRFVADTGVVTGPIPAARVDSLFARAASGRLFRLRRPLRDGRAGCERYATDLPSVITEVRMDGRTKRDRARPRLHRRARAARALEQRIDEVAGVRGGSGGRRA